ncbi:hypothetical protein GURASL_15940 [Geotalea uraniireducens]|uniref:DNA methylase N-4/N-6 domain-containing protein n=1 Tax=Geotalea uraniireducens TaxID=351604 RepID=A0ABN6VUX7_9BACT|nr:site-specific DNA-methyltransferase [Geotalea uraniireducens]BDV42671.1 hypothetical protein GURASL_15940 [Geotalea uraniireducens]
MPFLDWVNKTQAVGTSVETPYHLLQFQAAFGDAAVDNLLIQGDNLKALKALLPFYRSQVKCVYIDPPYNTQSAFTYYDDKLEHSQWLSMMYPRLELIRDLLADEGTIFVHIDDNELGYLIAIMDEIFVRSNRIGVITFKQSSASGPKAINPGLVTTNNYILYYAKNKSAWSPNRVYVPGPRDDRYNKVIENVNDHYSSWRLIGLREAFQRNNKLATWDEIKAKFADKLEEKIADFVVANANRVVRTARVAPKDVNESAREALEKSNNDKLKVYCSPREDKDDYYFLGGEQLVFYKAKTRIIDGVTRTASPLTNLWDDLLSNNLHNEGSVSFPNGKKPETLIKRCIELSTKSGDIVLDSFLGSGTTIAVAHKMGRRWIGIEMGDHAVSHCIPRMESIIAGEQSGISKAVEWQGGGGFRFYTLGEPVFDADGGIHPNVRFGPLAAYLWHFETGDAARQEFTTPFLGVHNNTAYYLLYNGILGDRRPQGGNVLTSAVLAYLNESFSHDGPRVIYGETTRLGEARLREANIVFKQIPYDIKAR